MGEAKIASGRPRDLSAHEAASGPPRGSFGAGAHLIELSPHRDARGSLIALEPGNPVPFAIERVFYIFDIAAQASRAAHVAADVDELVIAVSGSFRVVTVENATRREFTLERPTQGLFVPGLAWRELSDFSSDAVCLVLASTRYDPAVGPLVPT